MRYLLEDRGDSMSRGRSRMGLTASMRMTLPDLFGENSEESANFAPQHETDAEHGY